MRLTRATIRSAFLQDADSLVLKTPDILEIINYTKEKFPGLDRINDLCRRHGRSSERPWKNSGSFGKARPDRGYIVGMESGSANVLKMDTEGHNPEDIVVGGRRSSTAGSPCRNISMPGVGGKTMSAGKWRQRRARLLNP